MFFSIIFYQENETGIIALLSVAAPDYFHPTSEEKRCPRRILSRLWYPFSASLLAINQESPPFKIYRTTEPKACRHKNTLDNILLVQNGN